jgi:hypothetical protein
MLPVKEACNLMLCVLCFMYVMNFLCLLATHSPSFVTALKGVKGRQPVFRYSDE